MDTRYLKLNQGTIAYDEAGSGPLVICVPSMGDLRQEYRFLTPMLVQAGLRVVCMDVRGHGESSTGWDDYSVAGVGSDILALIRSLGGGSAVIVGASMAAGAAVWAAAEAPECVSGIVMLDPFVRSEPTWQTNLLYGLLFSRPWGAAAWAAYYNSLYPLKKPADFEAYLAGMKDNLSRPGRLEALQQMLRASKSASESRLPRVKAPVLVLMGTKDPDFKSPEGEAQWIAERLKCRYEMIEGVGHYPHAEVPEIVAPKMLAFIHSSH